MKIRKLLFVAVLAGLASAAWAGNPAEPIMEASVMEISMENSLGSATRLVFLLVVSTAAAVAG